MTVRAHLLRATCVALAFGAVTATAEPQMSAWSGQMEERKACLLGPETHRKLTRLQELAVTEAWGEVLSGLNALLGQVKGDICEEATVEYNIGNALLGRAKDEDLRASIAHYERALNLKGLSIAQENQIVYLLAQLNVQFENYAKAISLMERWFKVTPTPPANAYVVMAQALGQLDRWREALPYVEKAIASTDRPQESWYRLLLMVQHQLKDYRACINTLEILIGIAPDNKKYWDQLAGMHIELEQESAALSVMALAHRKGFVAEEKQIINLARLYLRNDAPYEAGRLLDGAIAAKTVPATDKNYQLLADAWIMAREWKSAAEVLAKGCEIAADGEMCVRRAQVLVDQLEYNSAVKAVDRAFQKGSLKRPGYAYMIQGRAAAETRNFKAAEEAFKKARGFEETKKSADSWLDYLQELQAGR